MTRRTKIFTDYRQRIQDRVDAMRSQWPVHERRQRAEWAQRLQERLWHVVGGNGYRDQGVWAVGAVTPADITRLWGG